MPHMLVGRIKEKNCTGNEGLRVLFSKLRTKDKSLQGWYWFDWANQVYGLSVLVVILPVMIPQIFNSITGGETVVFGLTLTGTSFYAFLIGFGSILVAIISPVVGVMADKYPVKKKLLWWYTLLGVICTALLGFVPYFNNAIVLACFLYLLSNLGFSGGLAVYFSFMPFLSKEKSQDEISSIGTAYGFAGGSLILLIHLIFMIQSKGAPWAQSFVLISSAAWWFLFGLFLFKNTEEPEISVKTEPRSLPKLFTLAFSQLYDTFKNIRKFKQLLIFLLAYLLFYDGVNTIASISGAYGSQVLKLPATMSAALFLIANLVAIPSTIIFGMLAEKRGPKATLMIVLITYCFIGCTAIGLSPLPLELPSEDLKRYDMQFSWDEENDIYKFNTRHNKPICCTQNSLVSESGEADSEFRSIISGILVKNNISKSSISEDEAAVIISKLENFSDHQFSIGFMGGRYKEKSFIGEDHYTILGSGPLDFWTSSIRDNIWIPLNISVEVQWIFLGILVGSVMGTIIAQSRSIISLIIPKRQSAEFFGFFSFIMKAAAMIGPLMYGLCVSLYDDRVGIFSVIVVIFLGTIVFCFFDLEKGIQAARKADQEKLT